MDVFILLLEGIFVSFEPLNLGLLIFGCLIGLFVGAMPGLGSVNGVATVSYTHLTLPTKRSV